MTKVRSITTTKRVQAILVLILCLLSVSYFVPRAVRAADGDLDAAFGTGDASVPPGVARTFFGANSAAQSDNVNTLAFQSTGKIIAGGITAPPFDFALARYTTTGTLDTTFGPGMTGKVMTDFNGSKSDQLFDVAIGPGDRMVAVGKHTGRRFLFFCR